MPARSVLLNVSIQPRGFGQEKANVVEEVKEICKTPEEHTIVKEEIKRERNDSATADYTPPSRTPTLLNPTSLPATSQFPTFTTLQPSCATCQQKTKPDGTALSHCKACSSTFYCSKDCQRVDWPSHKRQCVYRSNVTRDSSSAPISVPTSPTSF